MSFFASALRAAYKLSGAKKAFSLPEEEILKVIEKQNRSRGVFTPTDHKACYEMIDVNGFPCLIVRAKPEPSERAILYFFGGGMVIGPDKGDLPVMRKLMRDTGCRVLMEVLNDARLTITTTIADGMGLRDYPDIKSKWGKDVYCFFFTGLFYAVMGHPGTGRKKFLAKITGRTYEEADRILYGKATWRSWKNQDYYLIGKKTDYSLFEKTDMYLWYGIKGTVDKRLSAGLDALKKSGYPFEVKIFTELGHGGLAGEHPEEFSKEVQAAHRRSLEKEKV